MIPNISFLLSETFGWEAYTYTRFKGAMLEV